MLIKFQIKYLFTIILICFSISRFYSQAPPWQWARDARSNSLETSFDVAVNPSNGDAYVAGLYSGGLNAAWGATFAATNGSTDAFVAKYDAAGVFQWAIEIGGAGADGARSITLDPSGNIYITGYFNGTADFDPSGATFNLVSTGGQDVFIAKYSSSGAFIWAVKGGGASTDIGYGIYADANGVYVTGAYLSSAVFTSTNASTASTTASQVGNNIFIAKYNLNGVVQWVASAGSTASDEGWDVTADANHVYAVGDYRGALSVYHASGPLATNLAVQGANSDIFLFAYAQSNGSLNWAKNASSAGNDFGRGITSDGVDVYITGGISNNSNFPNPTPVFTQSVVGGYDAFVAKAEGATGLFLWVNQIPGTGGNNELANSITYHPSGRIFITGYYPSTLNFSKFGGPSLTATNGTDIFVAAFKTNSNFYYALSGGGTNSDVSFGIDVNSTADAYISGSYLGPATFGTTTLTAATNSNIVVAKCGCGTILSLANAGPNQTVCATSATLAGNTPTAGIGTWSLLSGSGIITSPNSPNSTISGLGLGANQFIWTISSPGCVSERDTVRIWRELSPSVANAGSSQSVCASVATMAANTPTTGSGIWNLLSGSGTISTPTSPNTGITGLGGGINIFQWTISYLSCPVTTSTMSITRYQNPTTSNAGPSQTICATNYTMTGNVPAVGTGSWTLVSGAGTITSPTLANTSITGLGVGSNIFRWTITNGVCAPSSSTVNIYRDDFPSTSVAGSSQSVCASSATITANTPAVGTGSWTLVSGAGSIISPTSPTTAITGLGVGANVFNWAISNGICATSNSTLNVWQDLAPTTSNAGPSQTICATNYTMTGNVPAVGTGSWTLVSGAGTITSPTLANTSITGLGVGSNIFQWTITNGVCAPSSSTVNIYRDDFPSTSVAGSSQSVCASSATITANTPAVGTGSWTLVSGAGSIISPTSPTTAITGLGVGVNVFNWAISNGICATSNSTLNVWQDLAPTTSNAGPSQTICATNYTMTGNVPAVGTGSWTLVSGAGTITSPTLANTSITGLGVGSNIFRWTITNGVCAPSSSTVEIEVDDYPTLANAGSSQSLCANPTATLNANSPIVGTGLWSILSGTGTISSPGLPNSGVTGLGFGTNVFQWTISNGVCPASTSTVSIDNYQNVTNANAGTSQTICATNYTMTANTPSIGVGTWSLVSGSGTIVSINSPSTTISGLGVGINVFNWEISNGTCVSNSTVAITRDDFPTASNAGTSFSVCANTATLNANTPSVGNGIWALLSGTASITSPSNPSTGITGLGIGTNIFQWTIANGVCPSNSSTVSVIRDNFPTAANAGTSATICASSSILSGNTPTVGNGIWSLVFGSGVITTPNTSTTTVTGLGVGSNIFQWTITNGVCPASTSTVEIYRDSNPTLSNAGPTQSVCATSATLAGNNPVIGIGTWSLVSGSGFVTSPTSHTSSVLFLSVGINVFQWTITNGTCPPSSSTVAIVRNAPPSTSNAGTSQTICASSATLSASPPAIGTGSWTQISGTGVISSFFTPTTSVTGISVGTEVYEWVVTNGVCPASTSTVAIVRDANPTTSNAGTMQTICSTSATLNGNTPIVGNGIWTLISGSGVISAPSNPNSIVSFLSVGTNVFQWTISNGSCPSSSSTVAIVRDPNPTTATAGTNQTICSSNATLTGNAPVVGTGFWSQISGTGVISSFFTPTTTVSGISVGTEIYQWSISSGVCPPSTATVAIIRNDNPTPSNAGITQSICATSATLSGNNPIVGTGVWTLISGSGVISSPTSAVTSVTGISVGTNVFQWTISNNPCASSSSTVAIIRDPFPTSSAAGSNSVICSNTTNLNGNSPVIGTGTWSVLSGSGFIVSPNSYSTSVTSIGVGMNVFQWSISNGVCAPSTSTVSVTRDDFPTIANAGPTQTLCTSSTTLSGNTPTVGTGLWTLVSGGGSITTPTNPSSAVTSLSLGTNVFQWTISNGVCPPSSSTVAVTEYTPPTTSNAGSNQTVCATSATLNGNTPVQGNGVWTLVSGSATISNPSLAVTGVTSLGAGINVFQWTITNGNCPPSSSTVSIVRDLDPSPAIAGSSTVICSSNYTLNGNTPIIGTGSWSLVSGTGTIVSPSSPNSSVTGLGVGNNIFQWTITNGVCLASSSTVSVTRNDFPTAANAGSSTTICATSTVLAGNTPVVGIGNWSVLFGGATVSSPSAPNSVVNSLSVGNNIFQWTISNGVCPPSTSTVSIVRNDFPTVANAGPSQTVCVSGSTNMLANTPIVGTGFWSIVSGSASISAFTSPTTSVNSFSTGTNIFQWTISNGVCPASTSTMIIHADPIPSNAIAGSSQTICATSTTLSANTPTSGIGTWSVLVGTGTVTNINSPTTSITGLTTGNHILQWMISSGVCGNSSSTLAIQVDGNPSTSNAGTSQSVCVSPGTVLMAANTPTTGSGIWSILAGGGSISNFFSPTTSITGLPVGTNIFQWTISNGVCASSSSTVLVNVDDNPTVANAGSSQTICASNGSTSVAGNSPTVGVGTWALISGSGVISSPSSATTNVTSLNTGTTILQWSISNGACPTTSSTLSIQVDAPPTTASTNGSHTICASVGTVNVSANSPTIGVGTWNILSGSGVISSPNSPSTNVTSLTTGTTIMQWSIGNGVCANSNATLSIKVDAIPTTPVITANASQTICVSTGSVSLSGNTPATGIGTWSVISGGGTITSPNSPTTTITGLTVGTTIVSWNIVNGTCSVPQATASIQVDNIPSTPIAGNSSTVCISTGSTIISANSPTIGIGTWSLVSGSGTISSPNSPTTSVTGLGVGTSIFSWNISNGFCSTTPSTLSVQVDNNPSVASTGPTQSVCVSGGPTTLTGNTPTVGVGTWSVISGSGIVNSPNSPNSTITGLTVGTTVLTWDINNGVCVNSPAATLTIIVDDVPTAPFAGSAGLTCANPGTVALLANTPLVGVGTWSVISGSGVITSTTSPFTFMTGLTAGTTLVGWTITNGACPPQTATVSIQVDPVPTTANAGANQTICMSSTSISANTPLTGTGTWSVISGGGSVLTPSSPTSTVVSLSTGINMLTWSIANGVCATSRDTIIIQVDANPSISNAGSNQTLCATSSTVLSAVQPLVGIGTWSVLSGGSTVVTPTLNTSNVIALSIGTNILEWTVSNGVCFSNSSTVAINVDANPSNAIISTSDQTICASSYTVSANQPAIGSGTWTVASGGGIITSPSNTTTPVTSLTTGTNNLVWSIGNGVCPAKYDTILIKVDANPSIANAGSDIVICSPSSTINAVPPSIGTGVWNVILGGGTVVTPTANLTSVNNLSVGINQVQWTVTNGVCPPSIDTVEINVLINLLPIVAGPDQYTCTLTPTLNATPHAVGTGTWIPVGSAPPVNQPLNPNSTVTFSNQGTYFYVWSVGYLSCPVEEDTVQITSYLNPSLALAGPDQYTCSLNTTLNANNPIIGLGTWVPLGTAPSVVAPNSSTTNVGFGIGGSYTYVWSIGNGTCPSENDTIVVNAFETPSISDAGPNQTICSFTTNLNGNLPSIGTGTWVPLNVTTSTIVSTAIPNTPVYLAGQGLFGFVWEVGNSAYCPINRDTVFVQAYTPLSAGIANAGPDITSDLLNNLMAATSPSIGVGTWSIFSGSGYFSNVNDPQSNFTSNGAGNYLLVWTVTNGVCTAASDTLLLVINSVLIPQVITPNGDGNNDFFVIKAFDSLLHVKLEVYNRWGDLVYKNEAYKNDFGGKNQAGEKLADDTYFYLLDADGKTYNGYLVIKSN